MTAGAFFRLSRMLHGYLSAFAFIALMFFAGTGLLLNHPDWLASEPPASTARVTLPRPALTRAMASPDPARAVAELVGQSAALRGPFKSGDVEGDQVFIDMEGVRGASSVVVDLGTGAAEISSKRASAATVLNDLHRGKNSGAAWAAVIDITAILVMVLSLIGYGLFFSLRFRLRTSLILTAASLAALMAIFVWLVP